MSDCLPNSSSKPADELAQRRRQAGSSKPKVVKPQNPHALPAFARPIAKPALSTPPLIRPTASAVLAKPARQLIAMVPSPPPVRSDASLEELADDARYSILSRRFSLIAELTVAERAIVDRLDHAKRSVHQAGSDLATEGEIAPSGMFIVSGWACRVRITQTGRRQILSFLLPGDGVCLRGPAEHISAFDVCALTTVETVDASAFLKMAGQPNAYPGLALAVEGAKLHGDIFTANHLVRLGIQTKAERVANLMMELRWRLQQTGLAEGAEFPMPLTRETLADALGISPSRVAWVLGWLRARNLFSIGYGRGEVLSSAAADQFSAFKAPEERFSAPRVPQSFSWTG
jgi:CRP-like cAMP-binding protein